MMKGKITKHYDIYKNEVVYELRIPRLSFIKDKYLRLSLMLWLIKTIWK